MKNASDQNVPTRRSLSALALAGWLFLCFSAAAMGSFSPPGEWYSQINKPSWNPPGWIFGPVWTVLYTLMAIAAWLVWNMGGFRKQKIPLTLFLLQLLLNALWSPLFFGLHRPDLAFIDILLLWMAIIATMSMFYKTRPLAGLLLIPYLLWVSFASILNFTLWRMNS